MGDAKVVTRMERNAVIVVIHIPLNNTQHTGRNVSSVRKRIISHICRRSGGTQKTGNLKCFSRQDIHEVENFGSAEFEYDTKQWQNLNAFSS